MKSITLSVLFLLIVVFFSCKNDPVVDTTTTNVSTLLQKNWLVKTAKENQVLVYTKGQSNNIRDYSLFKLNISSSSVTYQDYTTDVFTGKWEISSDNKTLILKELTPEPTNSNGTISFTINGTPTASEISLTRSSSNPKTGETTNEYVLN